MRCRKLYEIKDQNNISHQNVSWFGSVGIIQEGIAKLSLNNILLEKDFIKFFEENNVYTYSNKEKILIIDLETNKITYDNNEYAITSLDSNTHTIIFNGGKIEIYNKKINTPKEEIWINEDKLHNINYAEEQRAVRDDLIQRLSIFKKELWYRASYGLPLFDKVRNKGIIDAVIIDIITSHLDVKNILSFSSSLEKNTYTFSFTVLTTFTSEEIAINLILNN